MADEPSARYDSIADGYARYWAPVIRPAALRVLDVLAARSPRPGRVLDIGTGTGTLAIGALQRWGDADVVGIDASGEMVERARRDANATLDPAIRTRLDLGVALADQLPHADASFDAAVSSFVFQLVPNRAAALREAFRVLRPGGWLAYATWLQDRSGRHAVDLILDQILAAFGFDPPEQGGGSADAASPRAAADGLRRAGFREVRAVPDFIVQHWTPRSYAAFIEHFDEASLFDDLVQRERRDLRRRLVAALSAAPARDLEMRLPIVYVTGRRPA